MLPAMPAVLRLALILLMMLTGIGLGVARGTVQIAGHVVLCSGQGLVVMHGVDGEAEGSAHLCPDMALSLLNALAGGGAQPSPACGAARSLCRAVEAGLVGAAPPQALARSPPARA